MDVKLSEIANQLIEGYSKLLLNLQKNRFSVLNVFEVIFQRKLNNIRKSSDALSQIYAKYIETYNQYLNSLEGHDPKIHNLKHQFDIVSSMKGQTQIILNDREEKVNLYTTIYFSTLSLVIALIAIVFAVS